MNFNMCVTCTVGYELQYVYHMHSRIWTSICVSHALKNMCFNRCSLFHNNVLHLLLMRLSFRLNPWGTYLTSTSAWSDERKWVTNVLNSRLKWTFFVYHVVESNLAADIIARPHNNTILHNLLIFNACIGDIYWVYYNPIHTQRWSRHRQRSNLYQRPY